MKGGRNLRTYVLVTVRNGVFCHTFCARTMASFQQDFSFSRNGFESSAARAKVLDVQDKSWTPDFLDVQDKSWIPDILDAQDKYWAPDFLDVQDKSWAPDVLYVQDKSWTPDILDVQDKSWIPD
jgi:hypothetical protein